MEYDTSVRDSDGTMVQFLYGEDGLTTTAPKYLFDFKFQSQNFDSLTESLSLAQAWEKVRSEPAAEWTKSAYKKFKKSKDLAVKDPGLAVYSPSRHSGSTSEKFFAAKQAVSWPS